MPDRTPDSPPAPTPPSEPVAAIPQAEDHTILLAEEKTPPPPKPKPTPAPKPALVEEKPLWQRPEESPARRRFATCIMLVVLTLYAWMLSFYYSGSHPGVDQAGYLMTAR